MRTVLIKLAWPHDCLRADYPNISPESQRLSTLEALIKPGLIGSVLP